jgi:L-ribulose-5-phosphate 3-epimerase
MTRRTVLQSLPLTALAQSPAPAAGRPSLCLFSKHAAKLNYTQLGKFAKQNGFDGIDLTVRPGGHVLPEKVAEDLPRAKQEIEAAGSTVPMITTGLVNPRAPEAAATLRAAGEAKIPYWKVGYYRYDKPIDQKLAEVQLALTGLTALSRLYNVTAGFHNHSGNYVGSPMWDSRQLLTPLDSTYIGYYFDPAHATIEGGLWNWQGSLEIAIARLKMLAVKDFYWEKNSKGKWDLKWCPLGEGMVDWPKVFARLAKAGFTGPITLHAEYQTPDELKALSDDGAKMRKLVEAAYANPA